MESVQARFREALLAMDYVTSAALFAQAEQREGGAAQVAEALLLPVLEGLGEEWEKGLLSLAQIYVAGRICDDLTQSLGASPELTADAPVAMANLLDHHALGKRIVLAHLRVGGIVVRDYGSGITPEEVVDRAERDHIRVLLLSTLMLASALEVGRVKRLCQDRHLALAVVAGGAPFRLDPGLGRAVGADAVGYAASDALAHVRHFLGERREGI